MEHQVREDEQRQDRASGQAEGQEASNDPASERSTRFGLAPVLEGPQPAPAVVAEALRISRDRR